MLFGYILLSIALCISAAAAYYSIAGLMAIFAAAVVPIAIMGGVLEIGKIATTVWLHKYWHRAPRQFKYYLIPALAILMLITSMGIFGFLSKAHLDQAVPSGDVAAQVQIFDDKIKTEKDNIEAARKALKQMDSQVDERLSRSSDDKGAERAVQIRRSQQKERTNLQNEITTAQKKITALQEQREPIASQARKIEADVGPIRYIAALLYGDNPDAGILEKAVRLVIILIVLVFDPLALVLILAADQTFAWHREDKNKKEGWQQVWQPKTENPWADEDPGVKDFFARGKELAKKLDARAKIKDWTEWFKKTPPVTEDFDPRPKYEPDDGPLTNEQYEKIQELANKQITAEETAEVKKPNLEDGLNGVSAEDFVSFITANTVPVENSEPVVSVPVATIEEITLPTQHQHHDPEPIKLSKPSVVMDTPHDPEPLVAHRPIVIPDLSATADGEASPVNAGFGTSFPADPQKGDMFLRVDYLPSKLYKWNEKKWIEVDKTKTDSFAYDEAYIKHLIDKIASGEYDIDMISAAEQEQIQRYLNGTAS